MLIYLQCALYQFSLILVEPIMQEISSLFKLFKKAFNEWYQIISQNVTN